MEFSAALSDVRRRGELLILSPGLRQKLKTETANATAASHLNAQTSQVHALQSAGKGATLKQ